MNLRNLQKLLVLVISLFCIGVAYGQNIRVESFECLPQDATARVNPVLDANEDACALIKMVMTPKDTGYKVEEAVRRRDDKDNELWFYVPTVYKRITISHSLLGKLVYPLPEALKEKTTYQLTMPSNVKVIVQEDAGGQYLVMKVEPAEAIVYIDGELKALNGGILQEFLRYGVHTYRVEAPLYQPKEGSVEIADERRDVTVSLQPNYATLTLTATDAEIWVNDALKGKNSWTGRLSTGTYRVEARRAGCRTSSLSLDLVAGQKQTVALPDPEPMYASLNVSCAEPNAEVYIDGEKLGITPNIFKVLVGKHTVEVKGKEKVSRAYQVDLREGEVEQLVAVLDRSNGATSGRATSVGGTSYVAVDLGLSVKWADRNVGASSPSDYGSYFAWGETSPKSSYTEGNSVTYDKNFSDISGNSSYDAARANWGGSWRLPTLAECQELVNKCTWTWTTQGGHNGYKVTGSNGNSIFLPAAGWRRGSSLCDAGGDGYYWSSTPNESGTQCAYILLFYSGGHYVYWNYRSYGLTVRPVSE